MACTPHVVAWCTTRHQSLQTDTERAGQSPRSFFPRKSLVPTCQGIAAPAVAGLQIRFSVLNIVRNHEKRWSRDAVIHLQTVCRKCGINGLILPDRRRNDEESAARGCHICMSQPRPCRDLQFRFFFYFSNIYRNCEECRQTRRGNPRLGRHGCDRISKI